MNAKPMIENPTPTSRALLIWQRPLDQGGQRDRHAVAELRQMENGVSFRYLNDGKLDKAHKDGFAGYPGLPIGADFLDGIALDILMRRLPPRNRVDFGTLLERFGLPHDGNYSPLTLLAYTGARLTSDSFSICESFDGFDAPFSYVFDVAGNRHYLDIYNQLKVGEPLHFVREPDNKYDENAIRINRADGAKAGYVNRLQAGVVGRWVDAGQIAGQVFRVNPLAAYPRLFVYADISAAADSIAA